MPVVPMRPRPHQEVSIRDNLKVQEAIMEGRLNNPRTQFEASIRAPEYLMAAASMYSAGRFKPEVEDGP